MISKGLTAVLLLVSLVGCGAASEPTATPEPTPDDTVRIGLVIAIGSADDGGYNALSLAGVSGVAVRIGAQFDYAEPTDEQNSATLLAEMAASGAYDIIVTNSFELQTATLAVADQHPDIHFIGLDQFQTEERPNVTGIMFPEDQAGFLAGVLAANLTETGIIGGVYGPDEVPAIQAFSVGFRSGVAYVNPDAEVLDLFHPEDPSIGFDDIPWGSEAAETHLNDGADVVFTAAGDTGRGALVKVAQQNTTIEPPLYCIGVDTDQWLTAPQARPCLVSSAMKFIPQAVDEVVTQVLAGEPPTGNYLGPVGLAPYHDFEDIISDELRAELDQIAEDLISGVLDTGHAN
jgi:basic membrane protein A and related proteins